MALTFFTNGVGGSPAVLPDAEGLTEIEDLAVIFFAGEAGGEVVAFAFSFGASSSTGTASSVVSTPWLFSTGLSSLSTGSGSK